MDRNNVASRYFQAESAAIKKDSEMNTDGIRCENDVRIEQLLLNDVLVKRVKAEIDRLAEKGPIGVRRQLLSTSVRLSRSMSPAVHKMADHCMEKLGVDIPLELYVHASPQFNAACFKPEEGRLFVMFSSSLLEAFDENELMFVVGHEFGHHVYQHHDIPVGYILNGQQRPPPSLALQLFAWARYAEISADRAGAFCANDLDAVARALFKLASGLTDDKIVRFNLTEFLHQLDEMQAVDAEPGKGAPMQDWFSTHPFSPLRVKALQLFHQSGLMQDEGIGKAELEQARHERFIETLEPRYCIHYWAWAASLMRAVTTAYTETDHFKEGKIAVTGRSKNGKSPSVAIIHDTRITAMHASVSTPWESPLRLCDQKAWDQLNAFNKRDGIKTKHGFLGGTFGPNFNDEALAAGHSWKNLQQLAGRVADDIFISRNLQSLEARGVDMLFHPGTHDFSAYDLAWGGAHYPQIPIYLRANSGHGQKKGHPMSEKKVGNKMAFLLHHFFGGKEGLLKPPSVKTVQKGSTLLVTVKFPKGSKAESGRIWWMYDRGPDGSNAYIRDLFPGDQYKEMKFDSKAKDWRAEIDLKPGATHIDFFSNHRKTIEYNSMDYPTYISCPYSRVELK